MANAEIKVLPGVLPSNLRVGRKNPVVGFFQSCVLVLHVSFERRTGGFENQQILNARSNCYGRTRLRDDTVAFLIPPA